VTVTVADKLQIKAGQRVRILGAPSDVDLGVTAAPDGMDADAFVLFVTSAGELATDDADTIVAAATRDALTWVAYPKAGQLGTDLNRDSLAAALSARGVRPVRLVSIDDVWSALRFRPGSASPDGPR
jgi:hypothetical protein